jgi:hypothetical protein
MHVRVRATDRRRRGWAGSECRMREGGGIGTEAREGQVWVRITDYVCNVM